jgi:hypothetical protein
MSNLGRYSMSVFQNLEMRFSIDAMNVLQHHYPERLGVVLIVDAPFYFSAFWLVRIIGCF